MNFIDTVYKDAESLGKNVFTLEMLAKQMGLSNGFDLRALEQALTALEKQGKVAKSARGKYMLKGAAASVECTMFITKSGYAFARPLNNPAGKKDIYVAPRDLGGACHNDKVLLEILPAQKNLPVGDRVCGRVLEIKERGYKQVVGLLTIGGGVAVIEPDDKHFADSVFVADSDLNGATNGTKVVADIVAYPTRNQMAQAKVTEVLGDASDVKVSTLAIIRSYGLKEEFDPGVVAEADAVAKPITPAEMEGRKDFRQDLVITIDGDDARDFDDAFSLVVKDGKYYLNVHIADVSHYVKEGGKIDAEAFKRGTSVYFPDHVLPMLPVSLSNGMCSLNPDEDRLCLSCCMVLDAEGEVLSYNITKGIIHSNFRMTYAKVTKILNGDKELCKQYAKIVPMLNNSRTLAEKLIARRDRAGQLDFDLPEAQILVDEHYNTVDIVRKPRDMSDRLIEQFMVLTNEVVAKHFSNLKLPFVYRVHEDPSPERVANFASFVSVFGLNMNRAARPSDFQKILLSSKDETYGSVVAKVMLRSMQKARYSPENLGHFGLALKNYCHFTSPIRRYPDLTIHRIISYYLANQLTDKRLNYLLEFVEEASEQSSETERNAEEAERTVDDQKKAEFMADKVGQIFDATVSGASESGVFVELPNTVEGLIYTEKLPQDYYVYDEGKFALIGKNHIYKLGDPIKVKLDQVDLNTRHIDFSLAEGGRVPQADGKHEKAFSKKQYEQPDGNGNGRPRRGGTHDYSGATSKNKRKNKPSGNRGYSHGHQSGRGRGKR